jgi:hypothetical protein
MGAVLARAQFTSELGREWEVEIYDLDETGTPTILDFEVAAPGFTIQYESPNDDLLEPIKASKCSAEMIINPGDTGLETLITDIAQADDGRYFLIVSEDTTGSYVPYWWGPILTDMVKEPNAYPTLINLVATDALGRLKEIDYVDGSGNPTTGRKRFTEIIAEIIKLGGNGYDIVNKDFLKFATQWFHGDHSTTGREPMEYTAVYVENYWVRDRDSGGLSAPKCYDVLKSILHDWNARILLTNGYYLIEQATSYTTANRRETIIDRNGDNTASSTSQAVTLVNQSTVIELAGGKREWAKPVIEVNRIYEHRFNSNIVTPESNYFGRLIGFNAVAFPYNQQVLAVGNAGSSKRLIIDAEVELVITNRTGTGYVYPLSYIYFLVAIKLTNGTTTYYLEKDLWADPNSNGWVTSPSSFSQPVDLGLLPDGEQIRRKIPITISTAAFTEDDLTGEIAFNYATIPTIFNGYGSTTDVGVSTNFVLDFDTDPYLGIYSGDTVFQGRTNFVRIALEGGNNDNASEKLFTATNTSGDTVNEYDFPQNALIGSRFKSTIEPGLLQITSNKSTYSIDTGRWNFNVVSPAYFFNDLAVVEALRMMKVPRERRYATIFGEYNPDECLRYGSTLKYYVFCGGKFIANNDRWQGVWELVERESSGITSGSASLPNPTGLTGAGTPTIPSTGGLTAGLAGAVSQGSVNQTIAKGSTITGITIGGFFKSGVIGSGDDITVISASTGQSQVFTTTAKVDQGDTSISVSSATTDFDIGPGDLIVLTAQQQASQVNSVEVDNWTPGITVGGGSVTIGIGGQARYYKFQNIVMVSARIPIGTVSSPTGALSVTGLPYSTEAFNVYSGHAHLISSTSGDDIYVSRMQASANTVQILKSDNTNAADQLSNGCTLFVQIQYLTT